MSEPTIDPPTIARGEAADLLEQSLDLVPDVDDEAPVVVSWESDPADVLEQQRAVGVDDERDEEHQT
ncbi:MAG: hypothetical protein U0R68_08305 [Candidatus Nanopelagicales bacterium]